MKLRTTFIVIIIAIFTFLVVTGISHLRLKKFVDENYSTLEVELVKRIKSEFRLDGGTPFILYPHNLDSSENYVLTDSEKVSIEKHIASVILKPYKDFHDSILKAQDFVPFIKYPQNTDELGNFSLSAEDLESMKHYVLHLTDEVDKAIESSRETIGQDIDRLNTWISIWLGVLGFIGIFVPIGINLFTTRDIEKKIIDIEKKIQESNTTATASSQKAKESIEKAKAALIKANTLESVLYQTHSLAKIKRLDFQRITIRKSKDVGSFLSNALRSIQISFKKCSDSKLAPNQLDLFKETLEEFYLSFNQISRYLGERRPLQLLEEINSAILDIIEAGSFDKSLYEKLDQLLDEIINELRPEESAEEKGAA